MGRICRILLRWCMWKVRNLLGEGPLEGVRQKGMGLWGKELYEMGLQKAGE